jgi:hypothetical protein
MIADIEQGIIARLQAEISGIAQIVKMMAGPDGNPVAVPVQIKSYPPTPNDMTLKTLASAGSVLVRYTGSRYGKARKGTSWMVQDRMMLFEILIVSDSLLTSASATGIYSMLDLAGTRLMGYQPSGATGVIELVQDDYVAETKGSWEYGLIISVPTQRKVDL